MEQVLRLRGGGKKRKKKTYTKPKKVKHVHKAVKLAVLKFYRVDDNGKVQRLRKSCPNEECGVGVRMAVHKDRFYCGKCGLTVRFVGSRERGVAARDGGGGQTTVSTQGLERGDKRDPCSVHPLAPHLKVNN